MSFSARDDSWQPQDGASDDEADGQQESASGDEQESKTDVLAAGANVGLPAHGVYDDDDNEFECVIGEWSKKVMLATALGTAAVGGGQQVDGRSDIDHLDDVVRSYELKQRLLLQELLPQQLDTSATAAARSPESGSEGGSMTM